MYPEFARRVDTWRAAAGDAETDRVVAKYGTFNAAVRALVAERKL